MPAHPRRRLVIAKMGGKWGWKENLERGNESITYLFKVRAAVQVNVSALARCIIVANSLPFWKIRGIAQHKH